jgi:hypothetical protein
MNHKLASIALYPALLAALIGCGNTTAEPIGGGGDSSTTTTTSGLGGSATTTSTSSSTSASQAVCSPACGSSETCVEGACHAVMALDTAGSLASEPCSIVVDDVNVYWQQGEVRRVPKAGGKATSLAWTSTPANLVVDDQYLYWTGTNSGVHRANKLTDVHGLPFADGNGAPTRMAGDGERLYYLENIEGPKLLSSPTVPPLDDPYAAPTLVTSGGYGIGTVAVDADSVYWWGNFGLTRVDKVTKQETVLAQQGVPFDLQIGESALMVVDGDTVFYSTSPVPGSGGVVARTPKAGGESVVVVGPDLGASGVFTVDAEDVYFMTPTALMRVQKTGGTPVVVRLLDPPSPFPTCVAVDEGHVYWVDGAKLWSYAK